MKSIRSVFSWQQTKATKLSSTIRESFKLHSIIRDYRRTFFESKRNAYDFQSKHKFFITSNYIKDGLNAIAQNIEHFLIMGLGIYLINNMLQPPFFIDNEAGT